jgi:hypothetical protein
VPAIALDHQTAESADDVAIDLDELDGGVTGTKVVAPTPQDWIDRDGHIADIHPWTAASSQSFDPRSDAFHCSLRRPALKVVRRSNVLCSEFRSWARGVPLVAWLKDRGAGGAQLEPAIVGAEEFADEP